MKGDFTRVTFDAKKHFSRVLYQQGRVTLDADPNEQADILLHYLRTLARDVIGPHGGPKGELGFGVKVDADGFAQIGAGRYYVDGLLAESEGGRLDAQPGLALAEDHPLAGRIVNSELAGRSFRLYLDVWERHVDSIGDPQVLEPALGGPDTTSRSQVVAQVRVAELDAPPQPALACSLDSLGLEPVGDVRLAARLDPEHAIDDPCVLSPEASFRGAENQLYRVEIHRGGPAGTATFKWSRDNGSVTASWLGKSGNELIVSHTRGFKKGCWLELTHEEQELAGQSGALVRLVKVDGDRLVIDEASASEPEKLVWSEELRGARVRRWDQASKGDVVLDGGAVPVVESTEADGGWIDLEDGVQVRFEALGHGYRTGDYWLIPARVATEGILWPEDDGVQRPEPPRGILHHFAPLGVLAFSGNAWTWTECRREIAPSALPIKPAKISPVPPKPPGP